MNFLFGKLKHKVCRKPFNISFNCLIQYFCFHMIKFGEVSVKHHFFATDFIDFAADTLQCVAGFFNAVVVFHNNRLIRRQRYIQFPKYDSVF